MFLSFSDVDSIFEQRGSPFRWVPRTTRIHNLVRFVPIDNPEIFPPNTEIDNSPTHHSGELKHVNGFAHSGSLTLILGVTYSSHFLLSVDDQEIPRYFMFFQEPLLFLAAK